MHQGAEREQAMITEGRVDKQMCTGDILKKSLGLQLCGSLSFRNATNMDAPGSLLTGPAMAKVVLNKVDSHTGYSMQAQMRSFRVSFVLMIVKVKCLKLMPQVGSEL